MEFVHNSDTRVVIPITNREIQADVVVVGGGMSGCCAALAAARKGRQVVLVEQGFFLGGIATQVQFGEMNGVKKDGKTIYQGIVGEILDFLVSGGYGQYYLQMPMSSNPNIKVDRIRYNAEMLKLYLDRLLVDAGVQILFGCAFKHAQEFEDSIHATVGNQYESISLVSGILVDATGNADVADTLGCPTIKTPRDKVQTATTAFHLTNVDIARVQAFIDAGSLSQVIRDGFESGHLKGKILSICPIPQTTMVAINATRADNIDHESVQDISRGLLESRGQILEMLPFLRERVDGMEKATVSYSSNVLGIRDRRRIDGDFTLTGDDLIRLRQFDDAVAVGAYPIDIHDPLTKQVRFIDIKGVYKLPYRCMLPVGTKRLIVAGRAVSADDTAFAAIRIIPCISNLGEAAGHAAHLALKDDVALAQVDIQALQTMQHLT